MRSFNALFTLVAATFVLATEPTPTWRRDLSIDGDWDSQDIAVPFTRAEPISNKRGPEPALTNAQRLARGLKLLPPKRRRGGAALARRSAGPFITNTGTILITDANTNAILGYIGENTGNNNHFGLVTDVTIALHFSFSVDSTVITSSQLDISATDTTYSDQWPLMGGIDGVVNTSDDLAAGSANFAYVQGTTATSPGSPPAPVDNSYPSAEDSESAIWTYNAATQAITAQWVDSDYSLPSTSIIFVAGSNALVLSGDPATFEASFATSSEVKFTFVPSA